MSFMLKLVDSFDSDHRHACHRCGTLEGRSKFSSWARQLSSSVRSIHTSIHPPIRRSRFLVRYQKYSEAIKENPDDIVLAIFYANRAACCIAMKEYLDATHDGHKVCLGGELNCRSLILLCKAATLNPKYAKAWARIGSAAQALEMWDQARTVWQAGLSCLPAAGLTPAEDVLKAQFEAELKSVDVGQSEAIAREQSGKNRTDITGVIDNMPWNRALALAAEGKLAKGDSPSSGWVILNAYRDFIRGITSMGQMVVKRKGDNVTVKATPDALVDITNGILRDSRVFHTHSEFFEQLQTQMEFEVRSTGAWAAGGPKQIQQEVPQRLRKSGWLPVRRALSVTIRLWIMRGFLDSNMRVLTGGVEFYKRALDVLEWGRQTYPNVASEDRGVVFEASFVRGVRRLYISAVVSLHRKNGDSCGYSLDDIATLARDFKAETEASERSPECALDPGFYLSFWIYPVAEALAILGWCHMQLGMTCIDRQLEDDKNLEKNLDPAAATDFAMSAQYYIQAAEKYPIDDEEHPYLLAVALEALWWGGAPLRDTLPLCRKISAAMPYAAKIWDFSPMSMKKINFNCQDAVQFLADAERRLAEGTLELDLPAMPTDLIERRAAMIKHRQED
ncbi:hypothetical protein K438DRAFT_1704627 [Mycena galopus ATCC 62051]|nr:hypothetical protein K438DRAFT_1704627 [Mycena galopus ATCC 62051]